MKIIYGLTHIKRYALPVVALGVFDGMHVAHRRLVRAAVKKALAIKGTGIVLTFWPHPQKQESLYSLSHRLRLIEELGVEVTIVVRFNKAFARTSAAAFVKNILVKKIGAAYVYAGKNFRFGKSALGTPSVLKRLARVYHFRVKIADVVKVSARRVSSTFIRSLITAGKLDKARILLGRPVSILGTVIKGAALGRHLGFPTANIDCHHEIVPPTGIYAVRASVRKKQYNGVCYIGTKPTFKTYHAKVIEVHIFGFREVIYGQEMEIQFIKKIRNDLKFPTIPLLTQQIKKDIASAHKILQD